MFIGVKVRRMVRKEDEYHFCTEFYSAENVTKRVIKRIKTLGESSLRSGLRQWDGFGIEIPSQT